MKKLPKIGQRVVVKDNYIKKYDPETDMRIEGIVGQIGTVLEVEGDDKLDVLVKFDEVFSDQLHNKRGLSDKADCWWVSHKVIKKLPKVK